MAAGQGVDLCRAAEAPVALRPRNHYPLPKNIEPIRNKESERPKTKGVGQEAPDHLSRTRALAMSSHRLRIWEPDTFYLVSNRCCQSQCLLRPDDALNPVVITWLRRTVRIYSLELYAALILGDRFALIVRAPKRNLSRAMGYFQGNLVKALNGLRARRDTIFPDRFDAAPIFEDALLEQTRRLLRAPVQQGEVGQPGEWPGYTSWHQMTQEENAWIDARMELPPLMKLPAWADLDDDAYAEQIRSLVAGEPAAATPTELPQEEVAAGVTAGSDDGLWPALPALGAQAVRERDWRSRSSGPRPSRRRQLCHTTRPSLRRAFKARHREVRTRYDMAMRLWRRGKAAVFPAGTFPPGWCRVSDGKEPAAPPQLEGFDAFDAAS